jgi:cob(I)alamin adenosyltransferase
VWYARGVVQEPDEERMAQVAFDVDGSKLIALEAAIDALDAQLPKLTKFILPSGGLARYLHLHSTAASSTDANPAGSGG